LTGSNTIHHSTPALGGDFLGGDGAADRARHRIRWLALQDGLARAAVRLKNDSSNSDLEFRILNAFLIEEIVWYRDVPFRLPG
jgi:hypothetical protein